MSVRDMALKDTNTEALEQAYRLFCVVEEKPKGFFARLFRRRKPNLDKLDPIELVCWMERLERWAGMVKSNMRVPANQRYAAATLAQQEERMPAPVSWAVIEPEKNPVSWTLPSDLLDRKIKLDDEITAAKSSGAATKAIGARSEQHELLFRVNLSKC